MISQTILGLSYNMNMNSTANTPPFHFLSNLSKKITIKQTRMNF